MKEYTATSNELTKIINDSIESYINKLFNDNIIDVEKYNEMNNYRIVLSEKGFWGRLSDKILRDDIPSENLLMTVVKLNIKHK